MLRGHFIKSQLGFKLEHTDRAVKEYIVKYLGLTLEDVKPRLGRQPTFIISNKTDRTS